MKCHFSHADLPFDFRSADLPHAVTVNGTGAHLSVSGAPAARRAAPPDARRCPPAASGAPQSPRQRSPLRPSASARPNPRPCHCGVRQQGPRALPPWVRELTLAPCHWVALAQRPRRRRRPVPCQGCGGCCAGRQAPRRVRGPPRRRCRCRRCCRAPPHCRSQEAFAGKPTALSIGMAEPAMLFVHLSNTPLPGGMAALQCNKVSNAR